MADQATVMPSIGPMLYLSPRKSAVNGNPVAVLVCLLWILLVSVRLGARRTARPAAILTRAAGAAGL
jgi:hypothetical protein